MNIALKTVFASIKVNLSFVFLLFLIPSISLGGIYKWVDADGKTHYGNKPPQTSQVEKLNIKVKQPVVAKEPTKEGKNGVQGKNKDDKNELKPAESEAGKYIAQEKSRFCYQAKIDLQRIQAKSRIRQKDKDGNVRYLSEKERSMRIAAAKKKMLKPSAVNDTRKV